ncbi:hypothetical protein CMK10_03755 [Candidatus Poribacteria bacterium]|nr:hypothetical protein [Candidatus Poribacteria bacterium]
MFLPPIFEMQVLEIEGLTFYRGGVWYLVYIHIHLGVNRLPDSIMVFNWYQGFSILVQVNR